jgi:TPR repeat protein
MNIINSRSKFLGVFRIALTLWLSHSEGQNISEMKPFSDSFNLSRIQFNELVSDAKKNPDSASKLSFYFEMVEEDCPSSLFYSEIAAEIAADVDEDTIRENLRMLVQSRKLTIHERLSALKKAKAGDVDAAVTYGDYLWSVAKDRKNARKYYEIAAESGNDLDKKRLARVDEILNGKAPSQFPVLR